MVNFSYIYLTYYEFIVRILHIHVHMLLTDLTRIHIVWIFQCYSLVFLSIKAFFCLVYLSLSARKVLSRSLPAFACLSVFCKLIATSISYTVNTSADTHQPSQSELQSRCGLSLHDHLHANRTVQGAVVCHQEGAQEERRYNARDEEGVEAGEQVTATLVLHCLKYISLLI